jgi:hypothetical protein
MADKMEPETREEILEDQASRNVLRPAGDTLKPVAWQRRLHGEKVVDGDWHVISEWVREEDVKYGHPHGLLNVRSEFRALYTADQVKEMTGRLKTRIINAEAGLAEEQLRIKSFEVAVLAKEQQLAEAKKVITGTRTIVVDAAMTGFNCHDGDWAERLFKNNGELSRWLQTNKRDT